MDPILERYHELEDKVRSYLPDLDEARLQNAFQYADVHHSAQRRKDGSLYITHPLAVADLAADLNLDLDSIIAALLHDTIEDTDATYDDVARRFGKPVADLVEGVTKLTRANFSSKEESQSENLRKMLMAMSKDIRVILIKLCDRLHNMRTMQYQTPKKQREKALETIEIYAPLAHRLGMQKIKWELEDLSLQYLDPEGYRNIQEQLRSRSSHHDEFLNATQRKLQERMDREGIKCTIYGRVKHIYSIYRKMYAQQKSLYEIFDLYAFRVIVDTVSDCYNVLGQIHDMYNLVPDRFKDYISTPKPNLYQSLHTTVIGRDGVPFEVQIRTWEMHQAAEYGIAAHWKYKQGMANRTLGSEETFEWVRKLLESQQDTDAEEFVRTMKVDLFADEVFVFTPNGDVKSLPAGATPIDFAYSIHSAVGNCMTGATVNERIVPLDTELKNGDIVRILTSKNARGPSRDWMKIAKSNEARNKIRQWFKREKREENIATGRSAFESEIKRQGLTLSAVTAEDVLPAILKKAKYGSLDDMYAAIGYGGAMASKLAVRARDELKRLDREKREQAAQQQMIQDTEELHVATGMAARKAETHSDTGIIVEGLDNCLVKFAKCCTPVPGDPVIGFITKGHGISVHRQSCANAVAGMKSPAERGRWITVSWGQSKQENYPISLEISAKNRDKLFLDIAATLSAAKVQVDSLSAKGAPDGFAVVTALVQVHHVGEVDAVIRKLGGISGVMSVQRAGGN